MSSTWGSVDSVGCPGAGTFLLSQSLPFELNLESIDIVIRALSCYTKGKNHSCDCPRPSLFPVGGGDVNRGAGGEGMSRLTKIWADSWAPRNDVETRSIELSIVNKILIKMFKSNGMQPSLLVYFVMILDHRRPRSDISSFRLGLDLDFIIPRCMLSKQVSMIIHHRSHVVIRIDIKFESLLPDIQRETNIMSCDDR